MINPYADLGRTPEQVSGEEVEGQFGCQTYGCYSQARTAKYLASEKILTWVCPAAEHISKIEGFEL